jgi:hypothetical protein
MARLYSNENFPLPVVEALRALGHDVLTIQEAGKADKPCPTLRCWPLRRVSAGRCSP